MLFSACNYRADCFDGNMSNVTAQDNFSFFLAMAGGQENRPPVLNILLGFISEFNRYLNSLCRMFGWRAVRLIGSY